MNKNIEYILEKEKFPLQKLDYVFLGIVFGVLVIATVFLAIKLEEVTWKLTAIFGAIVIGAVIFSAYNSSSKFRKISTGFTVEQNQQLIKISVHQLKMRIFQDREYPQLFICVVPIRGGANEEIYLLAKTNYVLINSKKENPFGGDEATMDFVDRIGGLIFMNAAKARKKLGLPY